MKNCTNAKSPYRQDVLRAPQPGLCTFKIQNVRFRRSETVYAALQLIQTSHPQARRYLPQIRRQQTCRKSFSVNSPHASKPRNSLSRHDLPAEPCYMPPDIRKSQTECALFIIAHPVLACNLPYCILMQNFPFSVQFCIKSSRNRPSKAKTT